MHDSEVVYPYVNINEEYLTKLEEHPGHVDKGKEYILTVKNFQRKYGYPYALIDSMLGGFKDELTWCAVHSYLAALWKERLVTAKRPTPDFYPAFTLEEFLDFLYNLKGYSKNFELMQEYVVTLDTMHCSKGVREYVWNIM